MRKGKPQVSSVIRAILWVVGGEIDWEKTSESAELLREKCKSSLTSVGLVFVLDVGILSVLLSQPDSVVKGTVPLNWADVSTGLVLVAFPLLLSAVTRGFRRRLGWIWIVCVLPLVHPTATVIGLSPFVFSLGVKVVLFVSSLMLVASFELYDSGVNPHLEGLSVKNLEFNGSRFYFSALWLTILGVVLLVAGQAWYLGIFAALLWCLTISFVVGFERAMEV